MNERKHAKTPAAELETMLTNLFAENRDLFEELTIRGWTVGLRLTTNGVELAYGYAPTCLSSDAGFVVSRAINPSMVKRLVDDAPGARSFLR